MDYTLLSCIDSTCVSPMKFYGRFKLGPFAPGQGLTVANSLRRSLLSQLTGQAIPLVEIYGACHEYETLMGVRESVLDLLLNIKQLILTSDFEFFTAQVGFLNVKGPGIVRARDLKLPDFIYLVDGDQYIATLATNGHLNMKFIIACGKNHISHSPGTSQYNQWVNLLNKNETLSNINSNPETVVSSVENSNTKVSQQSTADFVPSNSLMCPPFSPAFYQQWKKERTAGDNSNKTNKHKKFILNAHTDLNPTVPLSPDQKTSNISGAKKIGYFPIDATFMPVTRVNYSIQSNDQFPVPKEQVILEVWTNGSIHPRHAIHKAAKALIQLFLPLQQMNHDILSFSQKKKLTSRPSPDAIEIHNFEGKQNLNLTNTIDHKRFAKINGDHLTVAKKDKNKFDQKILKLDIGNLDLTVRPYSCLKQANIHTVKQLLTYTPVQLLQLPNLGQRELKMIEAVLMDLNVHLESNLV